MGDMTTIQRWNAAPPESLQGDRVLLLRGDAEEGSWGFDYLDNFDLVVLSKGHGCQLAALETDTGLPTDWVPQVYVDRIWMRANVTTKRLLEIWREGDSEHCQVNLWRAIYETRPYLYLVPQESGERVERVVGDKRILATKLLDDWTVAVYEGHKMLWRSPSNVAKSAEVAIALGEERI